MELTEKELLKINGGISSIAIAGIVGAVIFIVGAIDGFVRPLACPKTSVEGSK